MGAVANVGPVSVAVDGSSNAFRVCLAQIIGLTDTQYNNTYDCIFLSF